MKKLKKKKTRSEMVAFQSIQIAWEPRKLDRVEGPGRLCVVLVGINHSKRVSTAFS